MKKIIIVCLCSLLWGCSVKQDKVIVKLAAAASLEKVFEQDIIPHIEEKYPYIDIVGIYDSSGKLQIQIEQGLDASIFLSASMKHMDQLNQKGFIDKNSITYLLENKLVLIKPKGKKTLVTGFNSINQASMIALGDERIVPAGQYAKMALTHYNMWNKIKNKVSLGTNVTEVLSWVENGSSEVGIVYASDVINNDKVEVIEECQLDLSIVYPIAMLENIKNKEDVQKVFDEICSEESLNIYRKSGFKSYEANQNN